MGCCRDALEQGKMIMLLRKGGIHEQNGRFKVAHDALCSTYEHQQPLLLNPDYASQVDPVAWLSETVRIGSWAEITDILVTEVSCELATVSYLERAISRDHLKWKPTTTLLLLRTYKLAQAQIIPYRSEYGGCKSWIDLAEPISITDAVPVLNDALTLI